MKAIRGSPRLSHWARNPFVTCLPSVLKTSTFVFGSVSTLRFCHYHYREKACKIHMKGHISHNSACVLLVLTVLNSVSIGHWLKVNKVCFDSIQLLTYENMNYLINSSIFYC